MNSKRQRTFRRRDDVRADADGRDATLPRRRRSFGRPEPSLCVNRTPARMSSNVSRRLRDRARTGGQTPMPIAPSRRPLGHAAAFRYRRVDNHVSVPTRHLVTAKFPANCACFHVFRRPCASRRGTHRLLPCRDGARVRPAKARAFAPRPTQARGRIVDTCACICTRERRPLSCGAPSRAASSGGPTRTRRIVATARLTARVSGVGWVRPANHPASSGRRGSCAGPAPSISAAIRRGRSRTPLARSCQSAPRASCGRARRPTLPSTEASAMRPTT
jgi:hypothetical protein